MSTLTTTETANLTNVVLNLNALLEGQLPSEQPNQDLQTESAFTNSDVIENGFAELGLNAAILRSIEKSGYTTPTPIQAQAIPAAMAERDLLLSAQTGSGKTAAFVLPILHKIAESKSKNRAVRALILTPTRELAYQVAESIRNYGAGMRDVFCVPLVGGAPYTGQIRALKKGVQIIVATPGRLLDHMNDGRIDFSDLSILVLDEADRMLDMGFADDINRILDATPNERQTIMSSATWDGPVGKIAASFTKDPERIAIKVETAHIDEKVYFCDDFNHKNKLLEQLVCDKDLQQAIIFTSTKRSSEQLAERLSEWGHQACYLHGDLPQSKRNRIVADLKAGKYDILVATDVAARGIDVPAISHVFNYDLPRQVEDYVHRIGRSGRAGRTGIAINLCSRDDRSQFAQINRYLKREMTEATVEGLEPRFIESAYDRSGKGRSGRNGRSSGSNNSGQNRSRSGGYANQNSGYDGKYSGFKGDANKSEAKSSFSRDGGRKDGFQKEGFKKEGFKTEGYKTRGERNERREPTSYAGNQNPDNNGKMLTSHEFNFFNETRRGRDDRPKNSVSQGDRPARKPHQPQETHYNTKERTKHFEGKSQGEMRDRSFNGTKPKHPHAKPNGAKSHNTAGFEGRHFENSRKRNEAGSSDNRSSDSFKKSDFQKTSRHSHSGQPNDKPFTKGSDGKNAVKRSGRMSQHRDSTGKPI